MRKVHAEALDDTLAENLSEIEGEILAYIFYYVNSQALLDSLAHTLGKV